MPEELSGESHVTYTVRELLDGQTELLRSIDNKLDGKADKIDMVALTNEVRGHDGRIKVLEGRHTARNKAWAIAGTLASFAVIIVAALISKGHW